MKAHRPHMPLSVKLEACLLLLGLDPKQVEFDHDPALARRYFNEAVGDYEPAANDPRYIRPRAPDGHLQKTTGRKGESRLSSAGDGDTTQAAKVKRLAPEHESFRRRLLTREPGEKHKRKGTFPARKMQSRPFPNKRDAR
jgi:hypothetical protein